MPRTARSYLVLPRLHPELVSPALLPEGALFLWPGLPRPPRSGVFLPAYPWTPDQAAACLADFERAGRDGAGGTHAARLRAADSGWLPGLPADRPRDLPESERRALRRFMEQAAPSPALPNPAFSRAPDDAQGDDPDGLERLRQTAQQTLLLAWLQEKQALELRELSLRARREQAALAGLLGEGNPPPFSPGPDDMALAPPPPLPPWRAVLAAAALFLPAPSASPAPDEGRGMAVLALDRDMSESLAHLAEGEGAPLCACEGLRGARLSLGQVLGRLRSAGPVPAPERDILFVWPSAWPSPSTRPAARV
ncbi:MAG: hypothetical protein J1E80_09115 [Desulfovibrionaceae bacterium]|nr:hypothetical protein [Desulfovibrionaceae bacterium]